MLLNRLKQIMCFQGKRLLKFDCELFFSCFKIKLQLKINTELLINLGEVVKEGREDPVSIVYIFFPTNLSHTVFI